MSAIADTDIVSQAVICQRVAVMVAVAKNRCVPDASRLPLNERLRAAPERWQGQFQGQSRGQQGRA